MKTKAILLTAVMLGSGATASAQQPQPYPDPEDPTPTQPAETDQPAEPETTPTEPGEPEATQPAEQGDQTVIVNPPPAQPTPEPVTVEVTPTPVRVTPVVEEPTYIDRIGMSLTVGAGVTDFFDADTRDFTGTGGGWAARLAIGTRELIGLELGYTGSAQEIDALGLDNEAILVSNGIDAALRLNLGAEQALQPFLFGGLGWRHFTVTNADVNTSSINESDDVLEFPVGAGLAYRVGGMNLELRGTFRPASDSDLIGGRDRIDDPGDLPDDLNPDDIDDPAVRDSKSTLHSWAATLAAGWDF